jgi:hypothetical protein
MNIKKCAFAKKWIFACIKDKCSKCKGYRKNCSFKLDIPNKKSIFWNIKENEIGQYVYIFEK